MLKKNKSPFSEDERIVLTECINAHEEERKVFRKNVEALVGKGSTTHVLNGLLTRGFIEQKKDDSFEIRNSVSGFAYLSATKPVIILERLAIGKDASAFHSAKDSFLFMSKTRMLLAVTESGIEILGNGSRGSTCS